MTPEDKELLASLSDEELEVWCKLKEIKNEAGYIMESPGVWYKDYPGGIRNYCYSDLL